MAAMALVFMISITLAAPWIAANVLGFDPLDTNLRQRNEPPTWAEAAWRRARAEAVIGRCGQK